jgi:sporulation protein YlmC with PRC-barrel domain
MRRVTMTKMTQFTIGAAASCTDGVCGEVSRVVIDPVARKVTHLVVEPQHQRRLGRLVPVDIVDATTGAIRLRCTIAEFTKLDSAEETQFMPGTSGYAAYRPEQVLSWPYYGLGGGPGAAGSIGLPANAPQTVTYDRVPMGEVTVRRGEHVRAADGEIGRVQGLVIDPHDHRVTHVLLQEGHLRGRKEVAIPIGAVTGVDDGIRLSITKRDVRALPPVDIAHPDGYTGQRR